MKRRSLPVRYSVLCLIPFITVLSNLRLDLNAFLQNTNEELYHFDRGLQLVQSDSYTQFEGSFLISPSHKSQNYDGLEDGGGCVPWHGVNTDNWWTHHPEMEVSYENDTHYCFAPMKNEAKAKAFRELYEIQFQSNCSNVVTKAMWSSGWGADFYNLVDGLYFAVQERRPLQVYNRKGHWHYAATKRGDRPVCSTKHIDCYFLDLSNCAADPEHEEPKAGSIQRFQLGDYPASYYYEFATRPQTWLRHEIYKFSKNIELQSPCTAMHVRRADVVLHGKSSRRYHSIDEYVRGMNSSSQRIPPNNTIFLLSDDQNAIEEALEYPQYNWVYIDRPRHRGAEGGWENQIPSKNPKHEVVVLLATFRLVRKCSSIVYSRSGLANHLIREMKSEWGDEVTLVNLDKLSGLPVFSQSYMNTTNVSRARNGMIER